MNLLNPEAIHVMRSAGHVARHAVTGGAVTALVDGVQTVDGETVLVVTIFGVTVTLGGSHLFHIVKGAIEGGTKVAEAVTEKLHEVQQHEHSASPVAPPVHPVASLRLPASSSPKHEP